MPPLRPAAFALPGALDRRTGGTIYDRRVIEAMRAAGRDVQHVALPVGFPDPSAGGMDRAIRALASVAPDRPLIVDGLAFGALETARLPEIRAPLIAMVHHPLGHETGLAPDHAARLVAVETANLRHAAHVVVPSPYIGRLLAADFGVPAGRITVASPGFGAPDPLRLPVTPPLILSVGLVAPRKGHDVLLRALARVADLEWQGVIAGAVLDPAHGATLVALRDGLGLADRVRFAGELSAEALADLFRQAAIFALATRYEGYGMVFSEALLHGLPIVATAGGAVPDTVPPGTGLLVGVGDDAAFAGALRDLLADPARRAAMAAAATEAGAHLPGWADTAAVMGGVIDALPPYSP